MPWSSDATDRRDIEYTVWIAHLWRRRRIRNIDVGLPFVQKANPIVRRVDGGFRPCSLYFDRMHVETVVHSDGGFAAVSYLRIRRAALQEKPESENDLGIPPLLEADFVRIQTLLHNHHYADTSIYTVSEPVTRQSMAQSRSPASSRKGNWVAVGNVCCAAGQDITFEDEVVQCFSDIQGSFTSVEGTLF